MSERLRLRPCPPRRVETKRAEPRSTPRLPVASDPHTLARRPLDADVPERQRCNYAALRRREDRDIGVRPLPGRASWTSRRQGHRGGQREGRVAPDGGGGVCIKVAPEEPDTMVWGMAKLGLKMPNY